MGASLYFGAAAVGGSVAGGGVAGAGVAVGAGAGVAVGAGVHAERIVVRIKIQATAIVRVVLVLEGFICFLLLNMSRSIFGNKTPF